jgi:hypothetical protein
MTVSEAQRTIRDEKSSLPGLMVAAMVLSDLKNADQVSYGDLLECLKCGPNCAGGASVALYERTGRPGGTDITTYSMDHEDWKSYLEEEGFIQKASII